MEVAKRPQSAGRVFKPPRPAASGSRGGQWKRAMRTTSHANCSPSVIQHSHDASFMTLRNHTHKVSTVAFSPQGTMLASGSHDMTVKLWKPDGSSLIGTVKGHARRVTAITFLELRLKALSSPVVVMMAPCACGNPGRDGCCASCTGRCMQTIMGHDDWITALAASHLRVRSWSAAVATTTSTGLYKMGNLSVWEPQTGKILYTLSGHHSWVHAVAVTPDGPHHGPRQRRDPRQNSGTRRLVMFSAPWKSAKDGSLASPLRPTDAPWLPQAKTPRFVCGQSSMAPVS